MPATTALPTAPFGTTGMDITRVGFGAWAIGGSGWMGGWGAQDDADSVKAIHAAVEAGINWVDTAYVYGFGHSEEVVARALRDLSEADRPFVFTNLKTGQGLAAVVDFIVHKGMLQSRAARSVA